jgi:hypothetical protein
LRESVAQSLMMVEAGPLPLAALFLEINAVALAVRGSCFILHELTVAWDLRFAAVRRPTPPWEQRAHSCLEILPFAVFWSAACLHWPQTLAPVGQGNEPASFSVQLRRPMMPATHAEGILCAFAGLAGAPHTEELWCCWRASRAGLEGRDTPDCLPELYKGALAMGTRVWRRIVMSEEMAGQVRKEFSHDV